MQLRAKQASSLAVLSASFPAPALSGSLRRSLKRTFAIALLAALAVGTASAQNWVATNFLPPVSLVQPHNPLLLTDGTVIFHDGQGTVPSYWYKLTPDINGSYLNGTLTTLTPLPGTYSPLYFSSQILKDGRVLIEGGEYNQNNSVWTDQGAIYDPLANTWTARTPPAGWTEIGDAASIMLPDQTYLQTNCCNSGPKFALMAPPYTDGSWVAYSGQGKADSYDEEGLTLLPNGKVLTVDANRSNALTASELFTQSTHTWSAGPSTIVSLTDLSSRGRGSHEVGPMLLLPNGTVYATGGAPANTTGHTSVYSIATGLWTAGPDFPSVSGVKMAVDDAPMALEPNGNAIIYAGPPVFNNGSHVFEWNGSTLTQIAEPPNSPNNPSYAGNMLVLPTGQIFFTDFSYDIEVYNPVGTYNPAWAPKVMFLTTTAAHPLSSNILARGSTYVAYGTQFNGLSAGASYGDDSQADTNFPLVRFVNQATGHVFYGRTHDFSTRAVATGNAIVFTQFDVPAGMETGAAYLYVVANGIPSPPVAMMIN
ncbi:MAG: hypothetical protein WBS19_11445 [Candidatus Korobacteraceae bacterium]